MLLRRVSRRFGSGNQWFWHSFKRGNCGNFCATVSRLRAVDTDTFLFGKFLLFLTLQFYLRQV